MKKFRIKATQGWGVVTLSMMAHNKEEVVENMAKYPQITVLSIYLAK